MKNCNVCGKFMLFSMSRIMCRRCAGGYWKWKYFHDLYERESKSMEMLNYDNE